MLMYLYPFFAALFVTSLIVVTKPLHMHMTAKSRNMSARQSLHIIPTPRVGGLSLVIGYIVGMLFLPVDVFDLTMLLGISTIPVFLGGFGEDMGFDVSSTKRLILSFISAVLAILVFQTWVTDVGLSYLWFMTYGTFGSLVFTIVLTGGISHSINLIDGLNGLSMGVSMMISLGLAGLAYSFEDYSILMMCGVVLSSVAGLFIFNFPFGKIFLGDAGAYSMGHVLTWIGILLISRNPEIAPFSVMLLFFWPVMDMLFAIYRRLRTGRRLDQPDRLHFHQLVMRGLELVFFGKKKRNWSNPLATMIILPMAATPIVTAQFVYQSDRASVVSFGVFLILFVLTYLAGMAWARRWAKVGARRTSVL